MDLDLNIPFYDELEECESESANRRRQISPNVVDAPNDVIIIEGAHPEVISGRRGGSRIVEDLDDVEQSNTRQSRASSKVVSATNRSVCPEVDDLDVESDSICKKLEERLAVGSKIDSFDQVYALYCEYGRCKGFSVRKAEQRYKGKTDEIRWKQYACSCSGVKDTRHCVRQVVAFNKMVTRTGCKANVRVSRLVDGTLRITKFESIHNHDLVPPDQTYLLRSARSLSSAHAAVLEALQSAGVGVSRACGFMEHECGGPMNVGFTRQDAYDHVKRKKKSSKVEDGDAAALMQYFIGKGNEEPFFYWKVQLDDDNRIMNLSKNI